MTDTLTRTTADATVPVAGTYDIDPSHSNVSFQVRHLGLSKVRGSFERFTGTIVVGNDPIDSAVNVELEADSFTTGSADRDGHVKSADFLDVENHPTLTFRSSGLRRSGDDWALDGELAVKGVSRPVTLDVEFEGAGQDPWGNGRVAFTASTEIDREDWGINWNQALETGGVLVGKKVKIFIDVQAVARS